ncbi:hypothetical protein GCM10010156_19420 [Planobispora rosea]|uniref:Secreted protein n=1 Tax=Planobispora rosea TaxID=35762 RepID=A0A8J3WBI6_PLARO|nr:hypothetical protein [Planobispora rosea]GGS60810.1 hypothetical protein GCM10010156_19420 [Planobispora rosea]GIH83959.1 hypothetical protein Pro02_23670 [Planobispora rosea]
MRVKIAQTATPLAAAIVMALGSVAFPAEAYAAGNAAVKPVGRNGPGPIEVQEVVRLPGIAHAAAGWLMLSSGTTERTIFYDSCQPPRQYQSQLFSVGAFDNRPPPGCQVVLVNREGAGKVLCVGRGSVPNEFRQSQIVRIQPGTAPPCGFGS